jgi:hypothetical protein
MNTIPYPARIGEWRVRVLGPARMPATTTYRFLFGGGRDAVFVAECDGDELLGDVFARGLAVDGKVTSAFDSLNRWLLEAGRGQRSVRALCATFRPDGVVGLAWAGHHGIYLRQNDGTIVTRVCPALALGAAPGVSARETLIALRRGDTVLVPNAPLALLLQTGVVAREDLFAREKLDTAEAAPYGSEIPSALVVRRAAPYPFRGVAERMFPRLEPRPDIACAF